MSAQRALRTIAAAVATFAVAAVAAEGSHAAYPGGNGNLVYENYETLGDPSLDPFVVGPNDPGSSRRLVKLREAANSFVYSPNGKMIAFEAEIPDSQIIVMSASGKNPVSVTSKVTACHAETFPTWSPDSKQIAFRCDRAEGFIEFDIYAVKLVKKKIRVGKRKKKVLQGKGLRRITDVTDAYRPFWSPLGDRIAYTTSGNAVAMVPAGGGQETIIAADDSEPGIGDGWTQVDWFPDGTVLAADGRAGIYIMDSVTGELLLNQTPLIPNGAEPVFSPDARELAFTTLSGPTSPDINSMVLADQSIRPITAEPGSERQPSWQPIR